MIKTEIIPVIHMINQNQVLTNVKTCVESGFDFDGLWCDQTLSVNDSKTRKFRGMLFTGLAFKYQPQPSDIETACKEAIDATVIPTTSGAGTGKEAIFTIFIS